MLFTVIERYERFRTSHNGEYIVERILNSRRNSQLSIAHIAYSCLLKTYSAMNAKRVNFRCCHAAWHDGESWFLLDFQHQWTKRSSMQEKKAQQNTYLSCLGVKKQLVLFLCKKCGKLQVYKARFSIWHFKFLTESSYFQIYVLAQCELHLWCHDQDVLTITEVKTYLSDFDVNNRFRKNRRRIFEPSSIVQQEKKRERNACVWVWIWRHKKSQRETV